MYIMQQQPSVSFLDTLRIRIKDLLKNGDINLDKLCQEISLSPRTLQRRLNAYNTNWKDLVDQVRSELANEYIKDPSISFTKLTSLLGYSEQSSFNRAFYRWFKKTPSEYRVSIR
jgi:AraC-like DNA-binding protein